MLQGALVLFVLAAPPQSERAEDAHPIVWNEVGTDGVRSLLAGALDPFGQPEHASKSRAAFLGVLPEWPNAEDELLTVLETCGQRESRWIAYLLSRIPGAEHRIAEELRSRRPDLCRRAVIAAAAFSQFGELLAPIVAELLERDDFEQRAQAAFTLARLTPFSVPHLLKLVEDPDPGVRRAVVEGIERAMWPYMTGLDSGESGAFSAWHGLSGFQLAMADSFRIVVESGIPALAVALKDDVEEVRAHAALALYKLGPRAAPARAALERARADEAPSVAMLAAATLERISDDPWHDLRVLRSVLRTADMISAEMLERPFTELLNDLETGADWGGPDPMGEHKWDDDPDVRWQAAAALLLTRLDNLIGGNDLQILEAIRRETRRHIESLLRVVDDTMGLGDPAARELVRLGPASLPAIAHDFLRYPRFPMGAPTYTELAWVLRRQGKGSIPVLIEGLEHWWDFGRRFAIDALVRSRTNPRLLMPFVLSAWRSGCEDQRLPGEDPLWEDSLGTPLDYALSKAEIGIHDVARFVEALGPGTLPYLRRGLRDHHVLVRWRCCRGLRALGKAARPASADLKLCLQDPEELVRRAAAEALEAIRGK